MSTIYRSDLADSTAVTGFDVIARNVRETVRAARLHSLYACRRCRRTVKVYAYRVRCACGNHAHESEVVHATQN
jgi:hypothetical protein